MSALLDTSNGRVNMAYIGDVPWHRSGAPMLAGMSIDEWVKAAGLGFGVNKAPVYAVIDGKAVAVPNRAALYRDDTGAILGTASKSHFKVVQPREVVEFFRDLTAELGFNMETAGSLKGGQRIWGLASNGGQVRVRGNDVVKPYLLCATAYDGVQARSTEALFTTERVVCHNTLSIAVAEGEREAATDDEAKAEGRPVGRIAIPHSKEVNWDYMKAQLGLFTEAVAQFEERANRLAERTVTQAEAMQFIATLFASYREDGKTLTPQSQRVMAAVADAYHRSPGSELRSADGTAWGLVNAVTYFVDHKAPARSDDNRLNSAWFGAGNDKKREAEALAVNMLLAA